MRTALLTIVGLLILTCSSESLDLPEPELKGMPVEDAIALRRSVRTYADGPLTLAELSQILFAAQGITGGKADVKLRSAPSAGGTYPFELYAFASRVEGLEPGIYHYVPEGHCLDLVAKGDFAAKLSEACLGQSMPAEAACSIVLAAVPGRTTARYGERGLMYVHMEAGHISQNIYLQCTSLGLGVVAVGAFYEEDVNDLIGLDGERETALYVNCIGRKVSEDHGD